MAETVYMFSMYIDAPFRKKKLNPIIVKEIKNYLLEGRKQIELFFDEIDFHRTVLKNVTRCHNCSRKLTVDWDICPKCPNVICKYCYTCKICPFR